MPDQNFTINFLVTREEAKAAHAAEAAAYKDTVKRADEAARSVEAAATREAAAKKKAIQEALTAEQVAAKAKEELIRRTNAAQVKALADAQDAELKAKEASKAAEREAAEAARKASREKTDAARKEAAERKDLARQAKEAEVAAIKAVAQAGRDRTRQAKQEARDRADADKAAAKQAAQAQQQQAESMDKVSAVGGKFVGILGMIGNAAYGLNGLQSVVSMIADSFERAKNQATNAGKMAEDYRKSLKELAFLKGEPGATAPVVLDDLKFRQATLQDAAGARSLQEEFRNTAGISIDTADTKAKMTEAEAVKGMQYAGQMQAMFGGEGGSYGTLAGVIPSTEKADRVSGDDIKRRMFQLTKIGEKGRSSPASFANQMAQSAYLTQGGSFADMGEQAAYGSALSLSRPDQVAQGLMQLDKMTRGSVNDMTKSPNAKMAPGEYLKSLNLTDQNTAAQMLQAMMADMNRQRDEMARQGKQFNVGTYLGEKGYDREEEKVTFRQLFARQADLNNTLIPMGKNLPTTAEADDKFNLFKKTQTGMAQAAAVNTDRTTFAFGGGALEYQKTLESRAIQAGLAPGGTMHGEAKDYEGSQTASLKMMEMLRQEGNARGLDLRVRRYNANGAVVIDDPMERYMRGQAGTRERAEGLYELGQKIALKGGDPMASNSQISKDAEESLRRTADALEKAEKSFRGINDKLNPPAVQVAPPGGANNGMPR